MTPSISVGAAAEPIENVDAVELDGQNTENTEQVGDEGTPEGSTEATEPAEPVKAGEPQPIIKDGKWANPADKAAIDKIQAENPNLAKNIRHALFTMDKFQREVPGGMKEVQQLRQTIEEMGGDEGLKQTREELTGWREFDQQYMAGDAKVLDFMLSEPAGQEAFLRLAPAVFDRFAEMDQPGFTHYICRTVAANIAENEIPLSMARLGDSIPMDHPAREIFNKVDGYLKGLMSSGKNAPKPTAKAETPEAQSALEKRAKEIDEKEANIRRNEWQRKTQDGRDEVFKSELKTLLGGRQLNPSQTKAFNRVFSDELNSLVNAHSEKLNAYFKAGDESGFVKFANSLSKKYVPLAIRTGLEVAMPGAKPGPKGSAPVKPGVAAVPAKPAAKGWEQVRSFQEVKSQVDWAQTRLQGGSASEGRVILRDGRRVQYPPG